MEKTRKKIAEEIAYIRYNYYSSFELSKDNNVLAEFYKLAIYCFASFPIPESHLGYIDSNLYVNFTDESKSKPLFLSKKNAVQVVPTSEIIRQLITNWQKTNEFFDLELRLRAVEVLFNWGHFDVSEQEYKKVNRLIDSLRDLMPSRKIKVA